MLKILKRHFLKMLKSQFYVDLYFWCVLAPTISYSEKLNSPIDLKLNSTLYIEVDVKGHPRPKVGEIGQSRPKVGTVGHPRLP